MSSDRPATPVTIRLHSERFRFISGEARLVPMIEGHETVVGEIRDDRITGIAIEPATTLFGFMLTNVTLVAAGRTAPAFAPALLLPTVLLTPEKLATGGYDVTIEARTIASVRVAGALPDAWRMLTVAQSGVTVETRFGEDDRATVLLADGRYSLAVHPGAVVPVVIDASSPAWLDVTLPY